MKYQTEVLGNPVGQMPGEKVFYLVDLDGCTACTGNHLALIGEGLPQAQKIILVFKGKTQRQPWLEVIGRAPADYARVLHDDEGRWGSYGLVVTKPMLLHLDAEGELLKVMRIEDDRVGEALDYLQGI